MSSTGGHDARSHLGGDRAGNPGARRLLLLLRTLSGQSRSSGPPAWPDGDRAQLMPLVADGLAIGTLAIGPRRHGVELLRDDRRLIITLAPLLATGLQNSLLVQLLESQMAV